MKGILAWNGWMQTSWLKESGKLWFFFFGCFHPRPGIGIIFAPKCPAHGPEPGPLSTNDVDHCTEFIYLHVIAKNCVKK